MRETYLEIAPFPRAGSWWKVMVSNTTQAELYMAHNKNGPWKVSGPLWSGLVAELMIIAAHQGCEKMHSTASTRGTEAVLRMRSQAEMNDEGLH